MLQIEYCSLDVALEIEEYCSVIIPEATTMSHNNPQCGLFLSVFSVAFRHSF